LFTCVPGRSAAPAHALSEQGKAMSPNKETVQKYMDAFAKSEVAEGTVRCARKAGDFLNAVFCDLFVIRTRR
jgi:hypothetical protein